MITLNKYYELLNRSATVYLTNATDRTTYYTGAVKDIPDKYDACEVRDFHMDNEGGIHFQIKYSEPKPTGYRRDGWKEGSLKVYGSIFHYWVKAYDTGSEWGIDGGKVSKLMIRRDGEIVCNYDRGWDIEPSDPDTQMALEILLHEYNW